MDKCLECGNERFSTYGFTVSEFEPDMDNELWQSCTCNRCGYEWNVVYKFAYIEEAKSGKIIPENKYL